MSERWSSRDKTTHTKTSGAADILAALDRGEIVRGDKGERRITVGDTEYTHYPHQGVIYYTDNGMSIEASVTPDLRVHTIRIAESDTGNTIFDPAIQHSVHAHITHLLAHGLIDK